MWRIVLLVLLLAGCSNAAQAPYDEMKNIVVDTLQTEKSKETLLQLFQEPSFRELLTLQHDEVNKALKETLLSEDTQKFWQKTLEDPAFKEALAKSLKKQQEDIMKSFMKDAEYQQQLTQFFAQPDMQKQLESILKGATMRKEIENVVKETIESPHLQSKWQKLIEESGKKQDEEKKKE